MRGTNRSGITLLEVMVAVVILAVVGTVTLERTIEASHAVTHARVAEVAFEEADAFLHIVTLWPREDLDRHLGMRPQGKWTMTVSRKTPTLYDLRLLDPESEQVILQTLVFRPPDEIPDP